VESGRVFSTAEERIMQKPITSPEDVNATIKAIEREISRVIIGYEDKIEDLLTCMIADGHLLMEGVPGIAKTTLSKAFAATLQITYSRIQFTQDLLPSDITGHNFFNQETRKFELRKGPVFTELLLADEINRAPPKTQSALLEAMQEKQVTIEGATMRLPDDFLVIATINPIETEGVYPLPEAQLDRFMMKSIMTYLPKEREVDILSMKSRSEESVKPIITREDIMSLRKLLGDIHVDRSIMEYITEIARRTRDSELLELGASPRAGIHMQQTARVHAMFDGRKYVLPDDVKAVAHKVMDHRLILSIDADIEGHTLSGIVQDILDSVEVPKSASPK
jgi:MoxR-like ATPase